jgi:preprotein translocase subunit SecG
MGSILDLPAHPLFVHAPLVLMPLACIATIAMAIKKQWRERYWRQLIAAVGVVLVATLLAENSGEELDHAMRGLAPIKKHAALADTTKLFVALLFVSTVALGVSIHRRKQASANKEIQAIRTEVALSLVVLLVGVLATIWMFRTGHEGARVVWKGTFKK